MASRKKTSNARSKRVGTGIIGIGIFLRAWVPRFGFLIVIVLGACERAGCALVSECLFLLFSVARRLCDEVADVVCAEDVSQRK